MGQEEPERLQSAVTAYRQARELADSARYVEEDAFHRALDEARRHQVGVRETAKLLAVPRSTIGRWFNRQSEVGPGPVLADHPWVTEEETIFVSNHVWRHDPSEQIHEAPFRIETAADGQRTASLRPAVAPAPAEAPERSRRRSCRFGRHDWDQRTNPENRANYEVCLRCNAYRDNGSPAAPGVAPGAAVQANIGGFGGQ